MKRNKLDIDFKNYDDEREAALERSRTKKAQNIARRGQRRRIIEDKHGACNYNESQETRREYGR